MKLDKVRHVDNDMMVDENMTTTAIKIHQLLFLMNNAAICQEQAEWGNLEHRSCCLYTPERLEKIVNKTEKYYLQRLETNRKEEIEAHELNEFLKRESE